MYGEKIVAFSLNVDGLPDDHGAAYRAVFHREAGGGFEEQSTLDLLQNPTELEFTPYSCDLEDIASGPAGSRGGRRSADDAGGGSFGTHRIHDLISA